MGMGSTLDKSGEAKSRGTTPQPVFATTRWSIVLSAGRNESTQCRAALEKLCHTYWYPLYAHARRKGHSPTDAQDLTQAFFAQLLSGQTLAHADPARGRFRSFLLCALNRFLIDEWHKGQAQKRGGNLPSFSLDAAQAEQRFDLEPAAPDTAPEAVFDRQWAVTLLEEVLSRLESEYREAGKAALFAALKQTLTGASDAQPYAELAHSLGLSESMVKVSVHRLRKRYRELLLNEISQTVESPQEAQEELRYLFQVLCKA
jgi:RNA polymerase sigma factor (sigma-70 family)